MKNFALIGAAGYIAPRHMQAIKRHRQSAGRGAGPERFASASSTAISRKARFFTEFERFDRHLDKLRRSGDGAGASTIVSICSPNYLHDSHIRFALRGRTPTRSARSRWCSTRGTSTACSRSRQSTGRTVNTILQLRVHPAIIALRDASRADADRPPQARSRPDLHHLARALVPLQLEGRREEVGRHRHQHRRPFLRHAAFPVRRPAGQRVHLAEPTCGRRLSGI